jgi:putative transposase
MARALSNDLRERVVARYDADGGIRKIAAIFGIAPSTVSKWARQHRETGSVAPKKMGGHRRPLLKPHRAWIEARLRQTPELTLEELRAELAVRGIRVSYGTVQKFVKDIGFSFKKNRLRQ